MKGIGSKKSDLILKFNNFDVFLPTGVTGRLQHLKDSGIGATWLSPFYKSPQFDSGYDISDFYDINPEYGTMADFEEMVKVASGLGK